MKRAHKAAMAFHSANLKIKHRVQMGDTSLYFELYIFGKKEVSTLLARNFFLECSYKKLYNIIKDKLFIFPNLKTELKYIFKC